MGSQAERTHEASLERRLRALEDIEAIKQLKARYAELCDRNYDPDGLASLFTQDAIWDGAQFGVYRGRDQIRAFFASVKDQIPWAFHLMIGPVIEIGPDSETATGRWYLFQPCSMTISRESRKESAVIQMAKYEDVYRREDGGWRFSQVKVQYEAITDLDKGWVAQRFRPAS